jgi:hypothetical protein
MLFCLNGSQDGKSRRNNLKKELALRFGQDDHLFNPFNGLVQNESNDSGVLEIGYLRVLALEKNRVRAWSSQKLRNTTP